MASVLLILQLILSLILTVLVLLQRSEGGALGIGGGGGGLMSGRSATTNIVRMTAIVGALFIVNCVALTLVVNNDDSDQGVVEEIAAQEAAQTGEAAQEAVEDGLTRTIPADDDIVPTVEPTPAVPDASSEVAEPAEADDTPPEGDDE